MSAGRHPRIGMSRAAGSGFPAPTLYLPLRTNLLDASTNGWTNTSGSNPTISSGVSSPIGAGCATFAGASAQRLIFGDDPLLNPGTGDWFLAFWIQVITTGNVTDFPCAVSKGSYQSSTGTWVAYSDVGGAGGMRFAYGNPWVDVLGVGVANNPNNEWRHIYIQRSGDTMSIWSSGVSRATASVAGRDFTSTHEFRVGSNLSGDPLNGNMQDVVYCKGSVLTSTQITALQTSAYSALL